VTTLPKAGFVEAAGPAAAYDYTSIDSLNRPREIVFLPKNSNLIFLRN
jgi:hypothetical protein